MSNALLWGVCWLGQFCIYESLAAAKTYTQKYLGFAVPWDTFSRAFWDVQTVRYLGTVITLGGLFVLSVLITHLIRFKNLSEGDKEKEPHDSRHENQ